MAYCNHNNKPYSFRKNFNNIDNDTKLKLEKLSYFFDKQDSINPKYYFQAPYVIYKDKHYNLDFFLSRKALKVYSIYRYNLVHSGPDSQYNLEKVVESLKFIKKFCIENQVNIDKYLYSKSGAMYDFVDHLSKNKISIYVLFYWDDFRKIFSSVISEDKKFIFGDLYSDWEIMYRKYMNSEKCRKLVKLGLEKIKKCDNI